jgi:hypothetical protein
MKKIITLISVAVAIVATSAPAQANTGNYSLTEVLNTCLSVGIGCPDEDSQNTAENKCNCTGHKVDGWERNGYTWKEVAYDNAYQNNGTFIDYRQGSGGVWRAMTATYCDNFGCSTYQ